MKKLDRLMNFLGIKHKIKMYRHTIKEVEFLPDGDDLVYYRQTDWSSIANYVPGKGRKVVLIEEKVIKVKE